MLNSSVQIRDFGRLLPWVASPSRRADERPRFTDVLTPEALRRMPSSRRAAVSAVLVEMCHERENLLTAMLRKMTAELREFSNRDASTLVDDLADPHCEATDSCETAEAYFRAQRDDLAGTRRAFSASADPDTAGAELFAALDRLDSAFRLAVACMQEARWLVLMANGGRGAPASNRTFSSGSELLAAIDDEVPDPGAQVGAA